MTDFFQLPSAYLALWEHCGGLGTFPGMGQAYFYLVGTKTSTFKTTFFWPLVALDTNLILVGSLCTFPVVSVMLWPFCCGLV